LDSIEDDLSDILVDSLDQDTIEHEFDSILNIRTKDGIGGVSGSRSKMDDTILSYEQPY
jgi:hypothetical protein